MHERIDVDSPLWDQATFIGKHLLITPKLGTYLLDSHIP